MKGFFDFLGKWGVHPALALTPLGVVALFIIMWGYLSDPVLFGVAFSWVFFLAPIWLPVVLVTVGWPLWIRYVRAKFIASQKMTLLEIRIPRDISKSPRAMEAVFDGFAYGGGETTFINRNFEGKVRQWWSFELVSFEGQVHFYLWTRAGLKEMAEAQIYAQYPGVEIYEVEDYATQFHYDPSKTSVWGCDFKLTKEDVFPIKTYIDYELEKDPKEEFKIDPISHVFEVLSALGPGEQMWVQIIFRQNKDVRPKKFSDGKTALFATESRWRKEGEEKIAEIREKASTKYKDKEGNEQMGFPNPTPGQIEQIKAIERSLGKNPFDVGIRTVYLFGEKMGNSRVQMITGMFRQFSSGNLNGFAPTGWFTKYNWPWQGAFGGKAKTARELVDAYKRRSWFWPPYHTPHYVLTSEELATLYHFPSRVVEAPGLARIPATKAEAPANIPL